MAAIPTPNYTFVRKIKSKGEIWKELTPTRSLPRIKTGIVGAIAITTAPIVNKMSDIMIVGFLPSLSAEGPPIREPIAAPRVARETIVYKRRALCI